MERNRSAVLVCLLGVVTACPAGEPKLVRARRVFPKGDPAWRRPAQQSLWAMRLSPDGKKLLYTRPKGKGAADAGAAPGVRPDYELVLRDLGTGKDTVLPVGPVSLGWRTVHTRFNPFDPSGKRLVLIRRNRQAKTDTIVLADAATGKMSETPLTGAAIFGRFDRTGGGLIVMKGRDVCLARLPKPELKPLGLVGIPSSVCPKADVVCLAVPLPRAGRGPRASLVLFDTQRRKESAVLAVHERNTMLDDWETQWTTDGRYLYYYDVEDDPAAPAAGGRGKIRPLTRVWDRVAGKSVAKIGEAVPLGPGPTPTTMVLAKKGEARFERLLLHDAASGEEWLLGQGVVGPVHAWGAVVVYSKALADGTEAAHVAEIALPASGAAGRKGAAR